MKVARIYWLSDSPMTCTGYSTISTNICNGLVDAGHEVFYQCHNYIGQPLPPGTKLLDGREFKFTIMGTGMKPYSEDLLVPKIRELKPDVFAILLDTFMAYQSNYLNQDFAPAKTLFYFPSDGGGNLPIGCENILQKCHVPIAMSKFGQQQVQEVHNIQSKYIPHAVDTKIYFPVSKEEKEKIKAKFGLQGKFVIGSVYRNQGRKMSDRMFKAFAVFAKTCPEAVLFCHSDPNDQAAVFNSIHLINKLGIQNRVIFSGMSFFKGFDYKKMYEIYNAMDVFTLSTSGEGFGVPIIEAMACEIPCVVTDYTTTKELLVENGKCGLPVPIDTELLGSWNVDRAIMNIPKCAEAFKMMFDNPKMREEMGKNGREKVLKYYDWEVVNKQWNKLIQEMVDV